MVPGGRYVVPWYDVPYPGMTHHRSVVMIRESAVRPCDIRTIQYSTRVTELPEHYPIPYSEGTSSTV